MDKSKLAILSEVMSLKILKKILLVHFELVYAIPCDMKFSGTVDIAQLKKEFFLLDLQVVKCIWI